MKKIFKKEIKHYKNYIFISFLILIIIILIIVLINNSNRINSFNKRINQLETDVQNLVNDLQEKSNIISEQSQTITDLTKENQEKEQELSIQRNEIVQLEYEIEQKKKEIERLLSELNELEDELGLTKTQLQDVTEKYDEAKPYQERVEQGTNLYEFYPLLADYIDYAQPLILNYLKLDSPMEPQNDNELWERGRKVYNWISSNYKYCGDKGLRVDSDMNHFQFFSPDELLQYDNVRCGDCDDFATLFAGLMYASGVPYHKVYMVCGSVSGGGHCWDWIALSGKTYRIDPTCSDGSGLLSIFGFDFNIKGAYYTSLKGNVDCMSGYEARMKMNPDGYENLG